MCFSSIAEHTIKVFVMHPVMQSMTSQLFGSTKLVYKLGSNEPESFVSFEALRSSVVIRTICCVTTISLKQRSIRVSFSSAQGQRLDPDILFMFPI